MTDTIAINTQLTFELIESDHIAELFSVVEANRTYLRQWLPWLDITRSHDDMQRFVDAAKLQYQQGGGPQYVMRCVTTQAIIGVAGFHKINRLHKYAAIGYWLAENYQGQGLMTAACRALVSMGFDDYALNKIEIRCAVDNDKSRAIPQRLGFRYEATLRQCEWLYDHYVDHAIYSLLASEYQA